MIGFTPLRFDSDYVLWYNNVTKLMSTGILPFIALIIINANIYMVLKRRQAISSRLINPSANHLKQRAADQAHVLFVICVVFLVCHLLRVTLGIHELFVIETYRQQMILDCTEVKFSTLVAGSVSTLMLTVNSSINFFIYSSMSHEFRSQLRTKFKNMAAILLQTFLESTHRSEAGLEFRVGLIPGIV